MAKGIAISLITVFIFMPGLILSTYKWMDKTRHGSFMPKFCFFGKVIRKITIPMTCIFALMIVSAFLSSINNEYLYGSSDIFGVGT